MNGPSSRGFGHNAPEFPHRGVHMAPPSGPKGAPPFDPLVSLRHMVSDVLDQGQIGSCVSHGICSAAALLARRENLVESYSPLALYHATRRFLGMPIGSDLGLTAAQALRIAGSVGLYPADAWPDTPEFYAPAKVPEDFAERSSRRRVVNWEPLAQDETTIRFALSCGYPVLVGIRVYDSFDSPATWASGNVPMPGGSERDRGGHLVMLSGYDDNEGEFDFLNSWGEGFGRGGFGTLPYDYIFDPLRTTEVQVVRAVQLL